MLRNSRVVRRALAVSIVLALCVSVSALAATGSGAAAPSQRTQKADKSAVLRFGLAVNENGGVWFDPAQSVANPAAGQWVDLIYDTMIHHTEDGKGAPGLATKWTTPDPSTVELTFREGVKFTDGTPFNAAAVKAAWDRLRASAVQTIPPEIRAITAIEAVDDTTVRIRLNQPVAKVLVDSTLRNSFWLGVPSPAAVAAGTVNSKPVGAGPYMFDSYADGQTVKLKRNPDYFDPKGAQLAGIDFVNVSAGPPAVSALQGDTVDLIWSFPPDAIEAIGGTPGLEVTSKPGVRIFNVGFCTSEGVFASKEARQAVQYALDRDALNQAGLAGTGTPTILALTPVSPFYNKSLEKTYKYNPKKAKALLKQAGIAPGTTVRGLTPTAIPQPTFAEVIQSQLKEVGLNLELTTSTNFPADAPRLKPDMAFVGIDPSLFSIAFERSSSLNVCNWSNPELSAAFATTKDGSKTTAEQQAAWDQFQEILLEESPVAYTVASPLLAAHKDKVKGIEVIINPYGPQLNTVYMTK